MIKEICTFINIPVTTFEKNSKQIQTTPELLEKTQQHDIEVLSSLNKFDKDNFDLEAFREAYMEFLHMSQMMSLKMERLQGKSDQYVQMAKMMENTFMMDSIYINFGIRPAQFHAALKHIDPKKDSPEVQQFADELDQR